MKWNVGAKIALGFGVTLLIFSIVGAVSYNATSQLIEGVDSRRQAYEVLLKLERVLIELNAVEVGQRSYILVGDRSYLDKYETAMRNVGREFEALRGVIEDPDQRQRLDALAPVLNERLELIKRPLDAYASQGQDAAVQMIKVGKGKAVSDEVRRMIGELTAAESKLLKERAAGAQADANRAHHVILGGILTALLFATLAGYLITRSVARPLQELTRVAERITAGDLNVEVAVDQRGDEVGILARAFERMAHSLRAMAGAAEKIAAGDLRSTIEPLSAQDVLGNAFARMSADLRGQIREMHEGANAVGSAAAEIVAATSQLAASASESAAAVSETTTTVEEVRQTAELASEKAKQVSDSAQKAAQVSQSGRQSTQEVTVGMERIRQQMDAIAGSMMRLSEQGQAIGQIIATVEDLSAQSNLLAVNAAIEAAKAGEHGKGFGVVAQEVRSLADQSREATNQVRMLLGEIQKATASAVMATEQGAKAVEGGTRQSAVAGDAIQALSVSATEAAQAATQIAASSNQQLIGVDQVAGAMESIKQASTQNVASARQLEAAARNLNELGQRLKHMVGRYEI